MKTLKFGHKGFTIIEVVLVLAIAGLIFLMVFIALPALQRNQRDTQRKSDLNLFVDALQRYAANNKGQYPMAPDSVGGQVSPTLFPEVYNLALNYLDWPGSGATPGGKTFVDPSTGTGYRIQYAHHITSNISAA